MLASVVDGVKQAQAQHPSVAAEAYGIGGEQLKHGGTSGLFTIVEFDVAVSAETSAGGKAEIKVWGTGLGGGVERKLGHENRVTFAVHVKWPMGEKAKPQASSGDEGNWRTA